MSGPTSSNRRRGAARTERRSWRSSARSAAGVAPALTRLGVRVRALRLASGLSADQAAERAQLDATHWRGIEAGQTNPTVATLVGIARALNLGVGDLFADD